MDIQSIGLFVVLAALVVFMLWSSRRRSAKLKAEQEAKARQTVPGAEVLLQGGLYGTIVAFDPDNLDQPAVVEIAPGVEIKVHSQAILRVVSTEDVTPEEFVDAEETQAEYDELTDGIDDDKPKSDSTDAEPGKKTED